MTLPAPAIITLVVGLIAIAIAIVTLLDARRARRSRDRPVDVENQVFETPVRLTTPPPAHLAGQAEVSDRHSDDVNDTSRTELGRM
ncbi:Vacuole morphology and inheritance protein 14 [Venturia inaequalis]|nr:Vacuole morphology and inheritance protein 14 [Venturia inaequalis]